MIYTVTFNPSLDYIVDVDDFRLGLTNRTTSELMLPGGKGINVSIVLNNLGIESTAIYFSAGFIGKEITRLINEYGINSDEIHVDNGCSRINLKLKTINGTEINGMGPDISDEDINELYKRLDTLSEGDTLVLAGSIPPSIPETIYSIIMFHLRDRGVRIVVDATRDLLVNVLEYKPFLVKPNNYELGEIFDVELTTPESVIPYAKKLREMGAENVIVSMAEKGAVFISSKDEVIIRQAPEGELINAVGSGDSMVAGFLAGIEKFGTSEKAFEMAVAAGSANAYSENLATAEEIYALMK